jgi:hypothetical protein
VKILNTDFEPWQCWELYRQGCFACLAADQHGRGMKKIILALALIAGALVAPCPAIVAPGFAQAPPAVPAEPDTERRTRYSGVSSVTTFNVAFDVYGDGTDYQNWVEVWVNGTQIAAASNWTMVPVSGSFTTLSRPIRGSNINIVFNVAQSGTIDIVGARRPRRVSQLSENAGVTARDFNQIVTDLWMTQRERWDRASRTAMVAPGETLSVLPALASRLNKGVCWDNAGNFTSCTTIPTGTFAAGTGILFTGSAPTTISNNIAAGTGIAITGTNPLTISLIGGVTAKTSTYQIAPADCSTTIGVSNGPWTLTLPSVAGFGSSCVVQVCNTDANDATHRAIRLSGVPAPSLVRLWMGQCEEVSLVSGAWSISKFPGRFRPNFVPSIFVDPGASNANDGLISNAAGNAVADVSTCITILQSEMDLNGGVPACMLTSGAVFSGPGTTFSRGGTGLGVIYIVGNGGIATLRVTTGSVVFEEYDFAGYIIFSNIQFDCSFAASHPCYGLFIHQQSGVDLSNGSGISAPGVSFNGGGTTDLAVWCDSQCKVNSAAPIAFTGSWGTGIKLDLSSVAQINAGINDNASFASNILQVSGGSQLIWSGTATFGASNSASQFVYASNNSAAIFASFSTSGTIGGGARAYQAVNGAVVCNAGGTGFTPNAGSAGVTSGGAFPGFAAGPSAVCTP